MSKVECAVQGCSQKLELFPDYSGIRYNGSTYCREHVTTCDECGGRGLVPGPYDERGIPTEITCKICNGGGQVPTSFRSY